MVQPGPLGQPVFPPTCCGPALVHIAILGSTGQNSLCLSPEVPEYQHWKDVKRSSQLSLVVKDGETGV